VARALLRKGAVERTAFVVLISIAIVAAWPSEERGPSKAQDQRQTPNSILQTPKDSNSEAVAHEDAVPQARSWVEQAVAGTEILIPVPAGNATRGRINIVRDEGGWRQIGGECMTGETFSFALRGSEVQGWILSSSKGLAWRIQTNHTDALEFSELPLGKVACNALPRPERAPVASASEIELRDPVPPLSSRPNVAHVLYLDFDGAIISDPDWAGGETIDAPRARLNNKNIQRVWEKVAGDYAAFNVDVTTNATRYENAAVGNRMRCVITRNDRASRGAGGIAYINSFSNAGNGFTNDIPCWVFIDNSVDACAEAVSHELGHTLGLNHDGLNLPGRNREYYAGQGRGATGWAPIMGVSYYRRLSQWSKGEYRGANNPEDDISVITRAKNGFGFAPDETGGGIAGAMPLAANGLMVEQDGIILNDEDVDTFRFQINGGKVEVTAKPGSGEGNVDLQLELLNGGGGVLAIANPPKSLSATISSSQLPAGTYYLRVRGVGKGDPFEKGYSSYGSIGAYHLRGKVLGMAAQN
jgi:hypothetical protein